VTLAEAPSIPRHFLRVSDLDASSLAATLDLAARMKQRPHGFVEALRGDTVVCFFEKPSTRTRVSFAAAAERLGMLPIVLGTSDLQLGRGETLEDTTRTFAGYAAAIIVRAYAQETVDRMAAVSRVPVINALTDEHHPCQALADMLTLREVFGGLEGLKVAYVGDGNNVARSLTEACVLAGVEIAVAAPRGYSGNLQALIAAPILEAARYRAGASRRAGIRSAHRAAVLEDPADAVKGAHAVYTDVWVSMGEEEQREQRMAVFRPYQVTEELMAIARPDAIFMHCLPAHRGEEVVAAVIDGPRSAVWRQAENRLPTEEAILFALTTRRWEL
jgi:ornithine carbamoyltransferase